MTEQQIRTQLRLFRDGQSEDETVRNLMGSALPVKMSFVQPHMEDIFNEWIDYKKSRRESYKNDKSLEKAYNKLIRLSGDDPVIAKEIIDDAMANNYSGFFAIRRNTASKVGKAIDVSNEASEMALQLMQHGH